MKCWACRSERRNVFAGVKVLKEVLTKTVRVLPCLVNRWLALSTWDAWVNKAKSIQASACPLIVWLSAYRSITIYDEIFQSQRTLTRGTTTMLEFLSDCILNDKNWKREKGYCTYKFIENETFGFKNIHCKIMLRSLVDHIIGIVQVVHWFDMHHTSNIIVSRDRLSVRI